MGNKDIRFTTKGPSLVLDLLLTKFEEVSGLRATPCRGSKCDFYMLKRYVQLSYDDEKVL